jgi:hypothetical protein
MGSAYSTDEFSKCGKYALVAKYNNMDNNWNEFSPNISNLSDKQMTDITPIMIARKNYRGEQNDGIPIYWTYNTKLSRLLNATWESELRKFKYTVSILNCNKIIERTYVEEQQRLAIHHKALLDYLENGVDGEIYIAVAAELAKMRTAFTSKV